jgi:FMN reductase
MTRRTIAVVSAGLRQPSSTRLLADRLAAATRAALLDRGVDDVDVPVVELRDLAHDIVNNLLTGFPSTPLRAAIDTVTGADGLIAVTPIFSASYSGLFKSFVDILDDGSLAGMPVVLAATGGTARHSLAVEHALRPLFAYQRAIAMPTSVFAATEDWSGETAAAPLDDRISRAAVELADQVYRLERTGPPDPFALTSSFESLLAGDN